MTPQTSPAGRKILAQARLIGPFIAASLTVTRKWCGRPQCRCAQENMTLALKTFHHFFGAFSPMPQLPSPDRAPRTPQPLLLAPIAPP